MAKFDVFVGRQEELALIDAWATRAGTTHLIAVQGDGGVGKTWLLLEVMRRYSQLEDFVVVYLDAAEQPYSLQYVITLLVRHLGPDNFPGLLKRIEELTRSYYDLPILEAQAKEREALQIAVEEINQQLKTRRLIYLGDTLEAWNQSRGEGRSIREFNTYAQQFFNALFVMAGRNVRQKRSEFEEDFGVDHVTYVELQNFDRIESREFFEAADPENFIAPKMQDKLYFLTNGRPVLLSLAIEWLSREVPLPEMAERSLSELKALPQPELRDLRERFEFELVDQVRTLSDPLDRAVLYMAQIDRRTDAQILSVLLEMSLDKAEHLMGQLTELSFVKYNPKTDNCMLHDEMKNLINKHAWPYIDPDGSVRRRLARQIIQEYYEPRIRELAQETRAQLEADKGPVRRATIGGVEWEQWRLETESLHYHLEVGAQEGIAFFEDRFAEARRNNHLIRMEFLLSEVETAGHVGIRDKLELRRAESLRLQGKTEQAKTICWGLLRKEDLSPNNRVSAHNILGAIAASTDWEQARQHYEAALQTAEQLQDAKIMGVLHNNLGQLYRLTSQLDQAITHYQEAVAYSKQAHNPPLVASATNNLAYVFRLQGDLAQADVLCRVALAQRKRLGLERDLAYSYLTKGEIDRDRGDLESAERYTKLALRSFDKLSEIRGQTMAYRSLANIRRHLVQYEKAEAYLERGIALAKEVQDEPLLTDLLNVYGREQRDRAVHLQETGNSRDAGEVATLFQRAESFLEQSLNLATKYGDQWLIVRSQFELALAYFLSGSRSDEYLIDHLDRIWEDASRLEDRLLQGYVQETRGEIAQRQGDHAAAAQHFGRAAKLIAQRYGREPERFFDRISDRLLDPKLAPDDVHALAHGILNVIETSTTDEPLESLRMLCRKVLELQALGGADNAGDSDQQPS